MRFIGMYALREMQKQSGWFAGLFLTDSLLLCLFGLLLIRILRAGDAFEAFFHGILLTPLLLALTLAVLAVTYRQKKQLCRCEYGYLRELGLSASGIIGIQYVQTCLISVGAALVSIPLSVLTMQLLRYLSGDTLWQSGWRNRSLLPYFLLAYGILLTASLLCCLFVFRDKPSKPFRDRWSKRFTMRLMQKKPRLETYTKIRRDRVRHEGVRICVGLVLLHILPMLFWILFVDTAFSPAGYTQENILRLSAVNGNSAPISHFLVMQIDQLEGVSLESTRHTAETSPPSYRYAAFRLAEENLQETTSAIRRIVANYDTAGRIQMIVPPEYTVSDTGAQNSADFFYVLLLLLTSCGISIGGTGMIFCQYLYSRRDELQVLAKLGLYRGDCFRMLWKTVVVWLTVTCFVSLVSGSSVWILYDWITYMEANRTAVMMEPYRISAEVFRIFAVSGIGYLLFLTGIGLLLLRQNLVSLYPDTGKHMRQYTAEHSGQTIS